MSILKQLNLPPPDDKWLTRFDFFWYNDREIFHDTQSDLDRKAQVLAARGINHVVTFSCTHFRWSFRRHWNMLTSTLARVVAACHKHGIRVTEHHSSHLMHNPQNADEIERLRNTFTRRSSSLDSWPGFLEDCAGDPEILDGVPLSSCRQIDGTTGLPARTPYKGYGLCFNNPHYRREYFAYLATLYQTGIDGIMTDDVQLYGAPFSTCACPACRKLFHEETGHVLPPSGVAWQQWQNNYDDPSWWAWLRFRLRTTERFHLAVKNHYSQLGLRPLRLNYGCCSLLAQNPTCYILESLPHLDWIGQEIADSVVIRYAWPIMAVASAYYAAVARFRNIPSIAYFFPERTDIQRFSWGLAMSWGEMYVPVTEGGQKDFGLEKLRAFERRHARFLRKQHRFARLAFYHSRPTAWFYGQQLDHMKNFWCWTEACCLCNVPFDILHHEELVRLADYDLLVLNEMVLLSDEELTAFRAFVENGGTLVWCGASGARRDDGAVRPPSDIARLLNIPKFQCAQAESPATTYNLGRGRIVAVAPKYGVTERRVALVSIDRFVNKTQTRLCHPLRPCDWAARKETALFLQSLLPGGPDLAVHGLPAGVIVSTFLSGDDSVLLIHLLNASGTLDFDEKTAVGHTDPIPFPEHSGGHPASLMIRKPNALHGQQARKVCQYDPDASSDRHLSCPETSSHLTINLDLSTIKDYLLVAAQYV